MAFRAEPAYRHGTPARTAVLLCNLGTPQAPTAAALRTYLREFLSDPRVVEIPRLLWLTILYGIILRVRPAKSARKYASIWMADGSPLKVYTELQAQALQQRFVAQNSDVLVGWAMRYGQPSIASGLDALKAAGATRILIVPLYPQYSGPTTASVIDAVGAWAAEIRHLPELRFVNRFHDDPAYIEALASRVQAQWAEHGRGERLVLSFHGVPKRTLELGDPYHCECLKTARLLRERLGLTAAEVQVCFQSRFGKAAWLQPYTEPTLIALATQGVKRVDIMCPGFTADCLETLEEINLEARDAFLSAGGEQFHYIACLNDTPAWIDALGQIADRGLMGWPTAAEATTASQASRALALAAGATD